MNLVKKYHKIIAMLLATGLGVASQYYPQYLPTIDKEQLTSIIDSFLTTISNN